MNLIIPEALCFKQLNCYEFLELYEPGYGVKKFGLIRLSNQIVKIITYFVNKMTNFLLGHEFIMGKSPGFPWGAVLYLDYEAKSILVLNLLQSLHG